MSEETRRNASLAGLQAQVDELSRELKQISDAAARRGKITAWTLIIVCAIVAIYLGVLYRRVAPAIQPDVLVPLAINQMAAHEDQFLATLKTSADAMVTSLEPQMRKFAQDLPELTDKLAAQIKENIPLWIDQLEPQLAELKTALPEKRRALAEKLIAAAPDVMGNLKPRLLELKPKIPEMTKKLGDTLAEQAPDVVDSLRDSLIKVMPGARKMLVQRITAALAEPTSRTGAVVDQAVGVVLAQHREDIAKLSGEDLSKKLQAAFEEAAGPVLDEFDRPLAGAIKQVREDLADLLSRAPDGLTEEEQLELRLVQLANTYFKVKMLEKEE